MRQGSHGMKSSARIFHLIAALALLAVGFLLVFDILNVPDMNFVIGLGSAVFGLLLLAVPISLVRRIGFIALILGTYITLKQADILRMDYIRYSLGFVLIAAGLLGVFHDVKGGEPESIPDEQTEEATN